MNPNDEPPNVS